MLTTPSVLLNHLPCLLASVLGNLVQWLLCSISPPTPPSSSPAASRISASYALRLASAARSLTLILLSSALALRSASRSLALILFSMSTCCIPSGSKAQAHRQENSAHPLLSVL